jgi:rare lipoprotein A
LNHSLRSWRKATRLLVLTAMITPALAACSGASSGGYGATVKRAAFTSKEFGVAVSPRVTTNPNPPKGGGRHLVGKPYTVRGQVYTPTENPQGYVASGTASWYGSDFHGRQTANGEIFSANAITAAHPTLPLPSYVRVTNVDTGRSLLVRVNDRGPYINGRIIDLSHRAADILGYVNRGMGNVHVQYVGPAPLNGDDTRMLLASVDRMTPLEQQSTRFAMHRPQGQTLHVASNDAAPRPQQRRQGLADDFFGLFGYADAGQGAAAITNAHAAANAMATRDTGLQDWVNTTDADALRIELQLGVFTDPGGADHVARSFALLGAVDEEAVTLGGRAATRLVLKRLKPGVARADVLALARELGLDQIVLY